MAGVISQPKTTKTAQGTTNAFGAPPNNGNRQAINNDCFFQTNDATPVNNVQSPQTVPTTALELKTPRNATRLVIIAAAALNVSEVADMSQYIAIPANTPISFDVARQGSVYVAAPTGTVITSFYYQTL